LFSQNPSIFRYMRGAFRFCFEGTSLFMQCPQAIGANLLLHQA